MPAPVTSEGALSAAGAVVRRQQALWIAAIVAGLSRQRAAEAAGVAIETARNWLERDPAVQEALASALRDAAACAQAHAQAYLRASALEAAQTLRLVSRGLWTPEAEPVLDGRGRPHWAVDAHAAVKAAVAILDRVGLGPRSELLVGDAASFAAMDDAALAGAAERALITLRSHGQQTAALLEAGSAAPEPDGRPSPEPAVHVTTGSHPAVEGGPLPSPPSATPPPTDTCVETRRKPTARRRIKSEEE